MIEGIDAVTKRILLVSTVFVLLMSITVTAFAEVVQPGDDFWYLDQSDVLTLETEGEIFFANQRLYDACGAEIVVVAIESTGGMAIDDYAYTLFNEWEIGGSKYLGFLLLMDIRGDDYYAMPGTMLGTYIDSARIGSMLDTYLLPDFSKGNYDAGVRTFFEAMYAEVVDVLNLDLSIEDARADYNAFIRAESKEETRTEQRSEPAATDGISIGMIVLFIVLLILLSRATKRFHSVKRVHTPLQTHSFVSAPRPRRSRSANSSMLTGYILGRMVGGMRNRHPGSTPHFGSHTTVGRTNRSVGSTFSSRSFSGFSSGGTSRSNLGSSGRSFSGFGGASRSGGASRGPSTRGGGAGRFTRR